MAIEIQPISPVALDLFGLEIRWYALAYILAFVIGFWVMRVLDKQNKNSPLNIPNNPIATKKVWDDLMVYVILGVILGGRLGYVLFYNLPFFIENPGQIFAIWNGGMAFHGGLIGVIVSVILFSTKLQKQSVERRAQNADRNSPPSEGCRVKRGGEGKSSTLSAFRSSLSVLDLMTVVAPIGLFFGRIANFINMEVMGRETSAPWGITFSGGDGIPRHASPLYEAALEGIALFTIMFCLWKFTKLKNKPGAMGGVFGICYAIFRIFAEQFRAPDAQIGFLTSWGLTMGQLLSFGMLAISVALLIWSLRTKR